MALDGVMLFLRLKDVTNTCKRISTQSKYGQNFFSAMVESWKKLKTSNVFSLFTVCWN